MMNGSITLAVGLVLGLSGAAAARENGHMARGAKGYPKGFHQPAFTSDARVMRKPALYTWPVSDRYRATSQPYFFGRAY